VIDRTKLSGRKTLEILEKSGDSDGPPNSPPTKREFPLSLYRLEFPQRRVKKLDFSAHAAFS
jgi:hypothetical protein